MSEAVEEKKKPTNPPALLKKKGSQNMRTYNYIEGFKEGLDLVLELGYMLVLGYLVVSFIVGAYYLYKNYPLANYRPLEIALGILVMMVIGYFVKEKK